MSWNVCRIYLELSDCQLPTLRRHLIPQFSWPWNGGIPFFIIFFVLKQNFIFEHNLWRARNEGAEFLVFKSLLHTKTCTYVHNRAVCAKKRKGTFLFISAMGQLCLDMARMKILWELFGGYTEERNGVEVFNTLHLFCTIIYSNLIFPRFLFQNLGQRST